MVGKVQDNEGWSDVVSGRKGRRRAYRLERADSARRGGKPASRGPVDSGPRGTRSERLRRRRKAKRVAVVALVTMAVLLGATAVSALIFLRGVGGDLNDPKIDPKIQAVVSPKPEKKEPFNVLIMGVDGKPWEKQQRTDTMILARIDPEQRKVWMVSVPRDTRVDIPGYGVGKANAAYFHGGPSLAIQTVRSLLEVDVHYYVVTNLSGFKRVVDAMGGIWIDVDQEIDDPKAAAANVGRRGQHIEKGYQLLDGDHALVYVRSRDFPDADFTRMQHQQTFFKALAQQSMKFGNVLKLPGMVKEISRFTRTNMSLSQMITAAKQMRGMSDENMQTATLTGEWRSPYIRTDETVRRRLSAVMKNGGDLEATSTPVAAIEPEDVTVTVRNGAGIAGVAGEAATRLRDEGFDVGEVGNANQFVYDTTLVVYKSDAGAAQAVADTLGKGRVVESRGMYAFQSEVLVMVGKDWEAPVSAVASPPE